MSARLLLCVAALGGCARISVQDLCENLVECPNTGNSVECTKDGEAVESDAEARGCGEELDAYVNCVDDSGCRYETACEREVHDLESCGVRLTPAE